VRPRFGSAPLAPDPTSQQPTKGIEIIYGKLGQGAVRIGGILLSACAALANSNTAQAHGIAGNRFFLAR